MAQGNEARSGKSVVPGDVWEATAKWTTWFDLAVGVNGRQVKLDRKPDDSWTTGNSSSTRTLALLQKIFGPEQPLDSPGKGVGASVGLACELADFVRGTAGLWVLGETSAPSYKPGSGRGVIRALAAPLIDIELVQYPNGSQGIVPVVQTRDGSACAFGDVWAIAVQSTNPNRAARPAEAGV